jgi:hypothetical protein
VNQFQIKSKAQKSKSLDLEFDIDLAFACLREAATAKAGILTFDRNVPRKPRLVGGVKGHNIE